MNINLSAPINQTGYGHCGWNILKNLMEQGDKVAFWPLPTVQHIQIHPAAHPLIKETLDNQANYDWTAPSIRLWHQFDLAQHVGRGTRIGYPIFELNKFKDVELHHLKSQDALCVCSAWAKGIIEDNGINIPIGIVPCGVDRDIFNENVEPALPELRKKNETVFMNISKWELRKGHDILIDAFNKAFEPSDNVRLIMGCNNPFYTEDENREWADQYKNSKMGSRVGVVEGRLATQQDVAALMATADAGVFPSHAEGWNLSALELMSIGREVILTDYSGHTEFATPESSLLISVDKYNLEDAYDSKWFNGQGQWCSIGDEQIDQLIYHMRSVHTKKQRGELKPNLMGIEVAKKFSWANAALTMTNFIKKEGF